MNSEKLPQWTEDLSASGRPAPAPPAAFLFAVRVRRVKRRIGQSMAVAAVLMVALAAAMWPSNPAAPTDRLAAGGTGAVAPRMNADPPEVMVPTPVSTQSGASTLVAFYANGTAEGGESESVDRDSAPVLRGGDRWDMDRVRAWVLN